MKSPSVSGSQSYKELYYVRSGSHRGPSDKPLPLPPGKHQQPLRTRNSQPLGNRLRKCYNCDSTEHLARDCKEPKKESVVHTSRRERELAVLGPRWSSPRHPMMIPCSICFPRTQTKAVRSGQSESKTKAASPRRLQSVSRACLLKE